VCVVCGDGQKGKRVSIQLVSPAGGGIRIGSMQIYNCVHQCQVSIQLVSPAGGDYS